MNILEATVRHLLSLKILLGLFFKSCTMLAQQQYLDLTDDKNCFSTKLQTKLTQLLSADSKTVIHFVNINVCDTPELFNSSVVISSLGYHVTKTSLFKNTYGNHLMHQSLQSFRWHRVLHLWRVPSDKNNLYYNILGFILNWVADVACHKSDSAFLHKEFYRMFKMENSECFSDDMSIDHNHMSFSRANDFVLMASYWSPVSSDPSNEMFWVPERIFRKLLIDHNSKKIFFT